MQPPVVRSRHEMDHNSDPLGVVRALFDVPLLNNAVAAIEVINALEAAHSNARLRSRSDESINGLATSTCYATERQAPSTAQ